MKPKKYFLVAGEASGDLHGSNLIKALRREDPTAEIVCWGGALMQAAGGRLLRDYRSISFMGFIEVLKHLRTILKALQQCRRDIAAEQPDALILIDFPGFNLRIASWAKARNFQVYYYISPQIWAWKEKRVEQIRRVVDKLFVILPFEKAFYQKHRITVDFVGHPLLDVTENYAAPTDFRTRHGLDERPIIALLPGSRKQEIEKTLSQMLKVVPHFEGYQFVIAAAPSQSLAFYEPFLTTAAVKVLSGATYDILQNATAALVTSGTATLETALFSVPQVVCYKGSNFSYRIAKRLIKVPFISLVNLIMGRAVVRELIQHDLNETELCRALAEILAPEKQQTLKADYAQLKKLLGGVGAAARTAQRIVAAERDRMKIS